MAKAGFDIKSLHFIIRAHDRIDDRGPTQWSSFLVIWGKLNGWLHKYLMGLIKQLI